MGLMESGKEGQATVGNESLAGAGPFERYIDGMSAALAITRGPRHVLVYANKAFAALSPARGSVLGYPATDAIPGRDATDLHAALDRALATGVVVRDGRISLENGASDLTFTVWPERAKDGEAGCIVELRIATQAEATLVLQRDLAEQMLLAALRERDSAHAAELSRSRAVFLAAEGRRLAESIDEDATLNTMAGLALPELGAWCIVDVIEAGGAMRRRSIIHPDSAKQRVLRHLNGRWAPRVGDPFGAPAVLHTREPATVADGNVAVLAAAAHDPEMLEVLRGVEIGPLLTVPLIVHERVVGAITFVAARHDAFTPQDIDLARDLASRSAMALDNSRMHGEAVTLKMKAEAANEAKSAFLGTMGHELRTPLNAIGGYVELIDMGLRGPVTEAQHADLARIRTSQRHLTALVTDILNFVRIGAGHVIYNTSDVRIDRALADGVALVEPLVTLRNLTLTTVPCGPAVAARADEARVTQILVNLLANAIKFTAPGGRIQLRCDIAGSAVNLRISDTGIGIPRDNLASIFEPFVQVRNGLADRDAGLGLGLTISRDLARGMGGDLTVESEAGVGSTFTLTLPRGSSEAGPHPTS